LFGAALAARADGDSDIKPYWIFTRPGGAVIERYVPALPLSREAQQYRRLLHGWRPPPGDRAAPTGRPDPLRRGGRFMVTD